MRFKENAHLKIIWREIQIRMVEASLLMRRRLKLCGKKARRSPGTPASTRTHVGRACNVISTERRSDGVGRSTTSSRLPEGAGMNFQIYNLFNGKTTGTKPTTILTGPVKSQIDRVES